MTRQERASIWMAEIWGVLDGKQTWQQAVRRAEKKVRGK
jgi:hypothetical protein